MSARSVMDALDKNKYEIVPLGITRQGRWVTSGDAWQKLQAMVHETEDKQQSEANEGQCESSVTRELVPGIVEGTIPYVDVIFPVLHGPYGEDGTLQGLLELADIPYVGSGVLGSALGMDKAAMKAVFRAEGLSVAEYVLVMRWEWEEQRSEVVRRVEQRIGYPCFVKPANLGSSVGVSKVREPHALPIALDIAARYDRKILVEKAIDAREIECSVLGNDHPIASLPGEVIPRREFYDYEAKYFDKATQLIVPADLPLSKVTEVQELAVRAFLALDCAGMARADFFLDRWSGQLYINELNTIPGFTAVSMYPKMWQASGISYPELLDRLIQLAFERHSERKRISTAYRTDGQ